MKHLLGLNEYKLKRENSTAPVFFEPRHLINSHLLLTGMSGTGKSFQSVGLLNAAAAAGLEVDIFDAHDELHVVHGAVAVRYSQATGYGYNPLELSLDPHVGGVARQVDTLVGLIRTVSPNFGPKQEGALRSLLTDTYAACGIFQNNPRSWARKTIGEAERDRLVEARQWAALREYYPTLADLRSFARRKVMALTVGGDNKALGALEHLMRLKSRVHSLLTRHRKAVDDEEIEKLGKQVDDAKAKTLDAYHAFVTNMETGREFDDVIKYDSKEVLISVMQRIELLDAAGIFRANEPPFGGAHVRVHQIKSLTGAQRQLFVKLRLREIFEKRKAAGLLPAANDLRHVVFLDEAAQYFNDDDDDIVNIIAREARKFGVGLWCAAQEPTSFPMSFLTNCGATILTGIHSAYWRKAASMLRISEESLKWVRPKESIAIKLMRDGQADPPFFNVAVRNPSSEQGRRVAAYIEQAGPY